MPMHILRVCALLALLLPGAAAAQQEGPRVTLTRDPEGPVTVGTPVEITATLLVPTYMPKPPVWPDLEIADAITRDPAHASRPVSERIGQESWSGIARSWEIIPQRPADYDLGAAEITLTYADPATNQPVEASLPLPGITFSATLPPGAEGMDPFLAASALTLAATYEGLPEAPKPGDAVTLTLTTTASGPPAMLLPPLASRIATPPGLRAYPKEPALTDQPGERGGPPSASRVEAVTYVIETPGAYTLPGSALDWWNTATSARETASTKPFAFDVPAPPGGVVRDWRVAVLTLLALGVAALAAWAWRKRHAQAAPSERRRYRALRRAIRHAPPAEIRRCLADWAASRPTEAPAPDTEAGLNALEHETYGPPGAAPAATGAPPRPALLAAVAEARKRRAPRATAPLPPLNPAAAP